MLQWSYAIHLKQLRLPDMYINVSIYSGIALYALYKSTTYLS